AHHPPAHTFTLQVHVGWRSIETTFQPGNFSGDLLLAMGDADSNGRSAFVSVLRSCVDKGAQVEFGLNGVSRDFQDPTSWSVPWQRAHLSIRKGILPLNNGDADADAALVGAWTS